MHAQELTNRPATLERRPGAPPAARSRDVTRSAEEDREACSRRYREQGYLVLPGLLSEEQVERLNAETLRLCADESWASRTGQGASPEDPARLGDVAPGPGAAPGAPEPPVSDAELLRRYLCIHMPHKASPVFEEALRLQPVVDTLVALVGPNVKAMQSMLFIKAEGKPGQAWHQDEYFIPTRDRSLTGVWIALDDASVDNGCLWVLPGSHAPGVIYPDREHDDPRFDCSIEAYEFPYRDEDAIAVELAAGSAIVFNGYLLHRSLPNVRAGSTRRALVNHYMSAESLLPWRRPPEGTHMAKADFRDVVLVAGEDPYAWKGIEDLSRPHVRPDRDGGCDR